MQRHRAIRSLPRQRGFSFFEVLIAALIMGIGVLGFVGLQVRALDSTGIAHFRSQATVIAADLAERIRMNPTALDTYRKEDVWKDNEDMLESPPTEWEQGKYSCLYGEVSAAACDADDLVVYDALEARFQARQLLPGGTISVRECDSGQTCVVIAWRGLAATECQPGDTDDNCIVMPVYL